MWNPPAEPERDLWWAAQRIAAPDTDDHTARHRRGVVRLPWTLDADLGQFAGTLVEAWVCCDPACGGVELGESVLELNHNCCTSPRYNSNHLRSHPQRKHVAGWGRINASGFHHGPYTAHWEPAPVTRSGDCRTTRRVGASDAARGGL